MKKDISRRQFLKFMGLGSAAAVAACAGKNTNESEAIGEPPVEKMTYRTNPKTGEQVSLLGYGMMRLPTLPDSNEFDQEMINQQVDYAIEHGLNYFDTSPVYCRGLSERCTGIALNRHKREEYFVATKLSNFGNSSREGSMKMYEDSFKELQVDYIDYYLLHAIGGSMEEFKKRYVDNGMMEFLMQERDAGRIRNLGFSFHGRKEVFDEVLAMNDQYHWDFVQIELNYLDWDYANEISSSNVDASYLYAELIKCGIPAVVMEPLLGGRLVKDLPQYAINELKHRDPQKSIGSWAFRYAGTPEGVLTVLSGMTYMEHLKDNLISYSPLEPLTEEEQRFLDTEIAQQMMEMGTIPCNNCQYCMPCPYGIDIPSIFVHYNKWVVEKNLPEDKGDENYRKNRRNYLISLDRAIPRDRQPDHCIMCNHCIEVKHCPQKIRIPQELKKIADLVEQLKSEK